MARADVCRTPRIPIEAVARFSVGGAGDAGAMLEEACSPGWGAYPGRAPLGGVEA
jgi:hypothetical protein